MARDQDDPKGKSQIRIGGRGPGSLRVDSKAALERMDELGYDPLEFAVKVAQGEILQGGHPWLRELIKHIDRLRILLANGEAKKGLSRLEMLHQDAINKLGSDYPDRGIQANMAGKLLDFAYPKLKAVEVQQADGDKDDPSMYTDAELERMIQMETLAEDAPTDGRRRRRAKQTKH